MIRFKISRSGGKYHAKIWGHASPDSMEEKFSARCGMVSVLGQSCAAACEVYGTNFALKAAEPGHLEFEVDEDNVSEAVMYSLTSGLANIATEFPFDVAEHETEVDGYE